MKKSEGTSDSTQKDMLLDLFLYAPIGLLYEFSDLLPDAVKRGKSQVQIAKLFGEMAKQKSKNQFEASAEEFVKEAATFFTVIGERLDDLYSDSDKSKSGVKNSPGPAPKTKPKPKSKKTSAKKTSAKVPFKDYDSMSATEVIKKLAKLTPSRLAVVIEYESTHKARKSVLKTANDLAKKKK